MFRLLKYFFKVFVDSYRAERAHLAYLRMKSQFKEDN